MNLAGLQTWVSGHKPEAAGVAVAGVAGLAYLRKRSAASKAAATPTTTATTTTAAADPYQSIASDVYNSLEPQIEALQNGVNSTGTGTGSVAPAPVSNATDVQFPYQTGANAQLQDLSNVDGSLIHRWTGVAGNWQQEVLATGVAPGAQVAYSLNDFGQQGRIDYNVAANGQTPGQAAIHGWYLPGQGWHSEPLAPPPVTVTSTSHP